MPDEDSATFAALHETRCDLVTGSLSRFDDPSEQPAKFDDPRAQVEANEPAVCNGDGSVHTEAHAWFETHRFDRFCNRAGKAPLVAFPFAEAHLR